MELEVFVSDSRGRPVRDLAADDFTLKINGEPVPVSHFHTVDFPGDGVGAGGDSGGASPSPAGTRAPDSAAVREPLQLVIYLDHRNLDPLAGQRLLPSLSNFLDSSISAGDGVMVVESGPELLIRQPFTSDRKQLAAALSAITFGSSLFPDREGERRELLREIAESSSAEAVVGRIRVHAESLGNELDLTLGSLEQLIGVLAGVPGRKSLLYISNGLPLNTAEELYAALEDKFQKSGSFRSASTRTMAMESQNYDVSSRFKRLADLAGSARVAFYTFDAGGPRGGGGISAQTGANAYYSALTDGSDRDRNSSLRLLAGESGGSSSGKMDGSQGILSAIVTDASSYYSLGFKPRPGEGPDPAQLEVAVRGRGLRARHRKVFRPVTEDNSMADGLRAALSAGVADNPLQIEVQLGEARRRSGGDVLVSVEVRVPLDRLLFIPRDGVQEGHLRFWLAARTGRGVSSAVVETPAPPRSASPRNLLSRQWAGSSDTGSTSPCRRALSNWPSVSGTMWTR